MSFRLMNFSPMCSSSPCYACGTCGTCGTWYVWCVWYVVRGTGAPYLFNVLAFSLIENHHEPVLRHFLARNMQHVLQQQPYIPVGLVMRICNGGKQQQPEPCQRQTGIITRNAIKNPQVQALFREDEAGIGFAYAAKSLRLFKVRRGNAAKNQMVVQSAPWELGSHRFACLFF